MNMFHVHKRIRPHIILVFLPSDLKRGKGLESVVKWKSISRLKHFNVSWNLRRAIVLISKHNYKISSFIEYNKRYNWLSATEWISISIALLSADWLKYECEVDGSYQSYMQYSPLLNEIRKWPRACPLIGLWSSLVDKQLILPHFTSLKRLKTYNEFIFQNSHFIQQGWL